MSLFGNAAISSENLPWASASPIGSCQTVSFLQEFYFKDHRRGCCCGLLASISGRTKFRKRIRAEQVARLDYDIPTIIVIIMYKDCTIYHRGVHVKLPSNYTYPERVRRNAGTRDSQLYTRFQQRDTTGDRKQRDREHAFRRNSNTTQRATAIFLVTPRYNGCAASSTVIVANSGGGAGRPISRDNPVYNGRKLHVILTVQVVKGEEKVEAEKRTFNGFVGYCFQHARDRSQRATPELSNVGDFRARRLREIEILPARVCRRIAAPPPKIFPESR